MARIGTILLICGAVSFLYSLMILHFNVSPIKAVQPADLMMACLVGGTFLALAGLVLWHRQSLRQRRA
jgi:hypothetical protein